MDTGETSLFQWTRELYSFVSRFIPIERWPLLIMSLFSFHNETRAFHYYYYLTYSNLRFSCSKHPHTFSPIPALGN